MSEARFFKEIGKRIAKARKDRGYTQERLAAESKMKAAHIGFIEQGRRRPTLATIYRLSKGLEIKVEDLFRGL